MALHTKKLYYRRGGATYAVDLYTTTAEVGTDYLTLRDGSTTVYAKIDTSGTSGESHIRLRKSGITKSLMTVAAPAVWLPIGGGVNAAVFSNRYHSEAGGFVVTGGFSTAGGISAPKVAVWNGTSWSARGNFGVTYAMSSTIYNGDLIVSGGSGGATTAKVARWDGSSWVSMGSFSGAYADTINIYNGDLYVAGQQGASGTSNYLGRWNGTSWEMVGSANPNAYLRGTLVNGTNLIAFGAFTSIGGISASKIASWNGSSWISLSSSTDGEIFGATMLGTDLLVTGTFTTIGGVSANRVAKWDGTSWSAMGTGTSGPTYTFKTVYDKAYLGGAFTSVSGVSARYVASWNGSSWAPLPVEITTGSYAYDFTDYGGLVIGGLFTAAGGISMSNIGIAPI